MIKDRIETTLDRAPRLVALVASIGCVAMGYFTLTDTVGLIDKHKEAYTAQAGTNQANDNLQFAKINGDNKNLPYLERVVSRDKRTANSLKQDATNDLNGAAIFGIGSLALFGVAGSQLRRYSYARR